MTHASGFRANFLRRINHFRAGLASALAALALSFSHGAALAQAYDCAGLQAQINALDHDAGSRSNASAGAIRQQRAQLDRAVVYARSLGCDRADVVYSGGAGGRCPGINAQIQQMQSSLAQLQAGGGSGDRAAARADLVARLNAYCRGQTQAAPRQRGFFETLFGIQIPGPAQNAAPDPSLVPPGNTQEGDEEGKAHGGSQAVCVRTCDGGFFPLNISAHHADPDQLTNLCQALCPNATVAVYTRAPSNQIDTAVSLEGAPYSELPNALKFQKTFDPACTCKSPGQSWVEALSGADRALGQERKGDILVTQEKSAELSAPSAPKADNRSRVKPGGDLIPPPAVSTATATAKDPANAAAAPAEAAGPTQEVVGPDGVKRRVRIVGPLL
ncbi:MAG: DUF2865 domain-containing protein [Methylocella sp.]